MENAELQEDQIDQNLVQVESEAIDAEVTQPTDDDSNVRVPLKVKTQLKKRAQQAEQEAEQLRRENEALRNQNNLASLAIQPSQEPATDEPLIAPNQNDFCEDDEWIAASQEYNQKLTQKLQKDTERLVQEQLHAREQAQIKSQEELKAKEALSNARDKYLDEAETLNAPDFLEAEDKLLEVWHPNVLDYVIQNLPNAHKVVYALGNDKDKALDFVEKLERDVGAGAAALGLYAAQMGNQNNTSLPEPDTPITGGAGSVSTLNAQIDKLRTEAEKTGNWDDYFSKRKKLRQMAG